MKEEKIHKEIRNLKDFKQFDVDQEWNSFLDKVNAKESTIQVDTKESSDKSSKLIGLPRLGLSIAASLILLIGCMYFFNLKPVTNIDPILAEETVPEVTSPEIQISDPEPVATDSAIAETVTPKESVQPKDEPTPKEKVTVAEKIIIENKPFAVTDISKPNAPTPEYEKYETGEIVNLEDGSTIEILDVAIMKIPESFEGASSRNIRIKRGNAEFNVIRNESKDFLVTTINSEVSVLGTVFRVISEGTETTVATVEGLVEFYSIADTDINVEVNPGEEYKFDGSKMELISAPNVEPLEESTYPLFGLESLFKSSYKDKVELSSSSFKKSERNTEFKLPSEILKTSNPENLAKIIEILKVKFDTEILEGDCDSCYIIKSIRVKDNK